MGIVNRGYRFKVKGNIVVFPDGAQLNFRDYRIEAMLRVLTPELLARLLNLMLEEMPDLQKQLDNIMRRRESPYPIPDETFDRGPPWRVYR